VAAREALSRALDEYEAAHSAPRSAAAERVLKALHEAKGDSVETALTDTVRAFAKADKWCRDRNLDPFIDTLVSAVMMQHSAEVTEREANDALVQVKAARKAIATLKTIAPHLFIDGGILVAGFDSRFEAWKFAIDFTESVATATLQSTHLKRQKRGGKSDYRLRAARRYLVNVLYTLLSDPDIAALASTVFRKTISDQQVRRDRRDLSEPKKKGRATS
jgi:hypothetical protein